MLPAGRLSGEASVHQGSYAVRCIAPLRSCADRGVEHAQGPARPGIWITPVVCLVVLSCPAQPDVVIACRHSCCVHAVARVGCAADRFSRMGRRRFRLPPFGDVRWDSLYLVGHGPRPEATQPEVSHIARI